MRPCCPFCSYELLLGTLVSFVVVDHRAIDLIYRRNKPTVFSRRETMSVLADGITLQIGDHVWSFDVNLLLYLLIAAIVGAIAEVIVGSHVPFGIVGATIAGVIGIW